MENSTSDKKNPKSFEYDFEKDVQDKSKCDSLIKKIEMSQQKLKSETLKGLSKENYSSIDTILQGLTALKTIITKLKK